MSGLPGLDPAVERFLDLVPEEDIPTYLASDLEGIEELVDVIAPPTDRLSNWYMKVLIVEATRPSSLKHEKAVAHLMSRLDRTV